jgi:peptide/nickel transport system substrate-binding protein
MSKLAGKRVLITGGLGFIGLALARRLATRDDVETLTLFDASAPPAFEAPAGAEVVVGDVSDGDGVRDLPDGRKFTPELQTSAQFSPRTAELISEYLRQVGIAVRIRTLDVTSADSAALKGEYEMAVIGYGGVGNDPDVLMRIRLSPRAIPLVSKAWGYNNPRIEELGTQQLFALGDASRRAAVNEIQRIVAEEVPFLSLYLPTPQLVFDKATFAAWYFTPGGVGGGRPGAINTHVFATGKKAGF